MGRDLIAIKKNVLAEIKKLFQKEKRTKRKGGIKKGL